MKITRRTRIITLVVFALIAAMLIVVATINRHATTPTPTPPSAHPAPTRDAPHEATASTYGASICGLPDGKWDGPINFDTATPLTTDMPAPALTMEGFGPGEVSKDGIPYCYPRNPTGAALAAANIMAQWQTSVRLEIFEQRITGPHQAEGVEYFKNLPADYFDDRVRHLPPRTILGLKVTPQDATNVDVTVLMTDSITTTMDMKMTWVDGDWKWLAPANDDKSGEPKRPKRGDIEGFKPVGATDW